MSGIYTPRLRGFDSSFQSTSSDHVRSSVPVLVSGKKVVEFMLELASPGGTLNIKLLGSYSRSGLSGITLPFKWRQYNANGEEILNGFLDYGSTVVGANIDIDANCSYLIVQLQVGVMARYAAQVDGVEKQLAYALVKANQVTGTARVVCVTYKPDSSPGFVETNAVQAVFGSSGQTGYAYNGEALDFFSLGSSYFFRHFAASGYNLNNDTFFIPVSKGMDGVVEYAAYTMSYLNNVTTGVYDIRRIRTACVVRNILSNAMTESGTGWGSTVSNNIYPGTGGFTRRSTDAGAATTGTITGTRLFLRSYVSTNSGIAVVQIDGSWTAANKLPVVVSTDYKPITNVVDNGSGIPRVTCPNHGFSTGARIWIDGVAGATTTNGNMIITVIDANTFDATGASFAGPYINGGTASLFRLADVGRAYVDHSATFGPLEDEWFPLATGLSNVSHTVRIENVGGARSGGTPGTVTSTGRVYVVTLSAASPSYTNPANPGDSMAITEDVLEWKQATAASTLSVVPKYGPTGGSLAFIGGVHTIETGQSIQLYLNGILTTAITVGQYSPFRVAETVATSSVPHPDGGGVGVSGTVATKRTRSRYSADAHIQAAVECSIAYTVAGRVQEVYHGALTVVSQPYRGIASTGFSRAIVNGEVLGPWTDTNTVTPIAVPVRTNKWDRAVFVNQESGWNAGIACLDIDTVDDFQDAGSQVLLHDRQNTSVDGGAKVYFQSGQGGTDRAVTTTTVHRCFVGYKVWPKAGLINAGPWA